MKIVIGGASGFIGSNLTKHFEEKGHEVISLNRKLFQDDESDTLLTDVLSGADVVVNLAGATINRRWNSSYKKEIYDSRIVTTRKIVEAINALQDKPSLFISTSAVGYYPNKGCFDEQNSKKGEGFLSGLCETWEQEAKKVSPDVRLVIARLGVVLAKTGGAFNNLRLSAKFKVATVIGSGNQPFAWISLVDLIKAVDYILSYPSISGVVNFVTPNQVTNRALTQAIGKYEGTLFTIAIPKFFINALIGEAASIATTGQCVIPQKLLDAGFVFEYPDIDKLLDNLYTKN